MPLSKLTFRTGLNTQLSRTANEGGWSDGGFVRFRDGLPQKRGGWVLYTTSPLAGIPRASWAWNSLDGTTYVAFGTHKAIYLLKGINVYDITPIVATSEYAQTSWVLIQDTHYGSVISNITPSVGQIVGPGFNLVGDVNPFIPGPWEIIATSGNPPYVTAYFDNRYTSHGTYGSPGGYGIAKYELAGGPADGGSTAGIGYGTIGEGTIGTPRTTDPTLILLHTWSLCNFGEILLAVPRGGKLYNWLPSSGTSTHATEVTNGSSGPPQKIGFVLMGMPERHVVLLGTSALNSASGFDPMLVRFSNVEDYSVWNATATNSAGSFRLEGGSRLISGLSIRSQILIWSDTCLFSMRFIGAPYFYGFDRISTNCGIVGPHAMIMFGGAVYWMGSNNFWVFRGGSPEPINCPIFARVFRDFNSDQGEKVTCGTLGANGEIIWHYPDTRSTEPNCYAAYNTMTGEWDYGYIERTTWCESDVLTHPIATDASGWIYRHETGCDGTAPTTTTPPVAPIDAFITSGYFDIGDGTDFMLVNKVLPDFDYQLGNVYITLFATDYPNANVRTYGPYTCSPTKPYFTTRVRGRQIAFKFETKDIGADFRLGAVRINSIPDGQR